MTELCTTFNSNIWRPHICRDCTRTQDEHLVSGQKSTPAMSTLCQTANDDDRNNSTSVTEQSLLPPLPLCRLGLNCHRTNPTHFEKYSHPLGHQRTSKLTSTRRSKHRRTIDPKKHNEYRFIELVEKHVQELIVQLKLKTEEIEKLKLDQSKMVDYHRSLEKALVDELEHRERREFERQHMLTIPQQTPSYWGPNAFSQSYREKIISNRSAEFDVISELLNSTIATHANQHGTINGRDPTEFVVIQIKRIHNVTLWHEYCYKKESIINKNNGNLADCGSSIYLERNPLLTPLLDEQANEYWLFHGCCHETIRNLLSIGYDPRISNLEGVFGGGFYLAENSSKSNQYIPCPGCGENFRFGKTECICRNQDDIVFTMILYRAVLGDVHIALKYDPKKYRDGLDKNGKVSRVRRPPMKVNGIDVYDSVMGESVKNGNGQLQHREFILYDRGQAYPEYLISFRRSSKHTRPPTDTKCLHKKCRHFLDNTFRSVPE